MCQLFSIIIILLFGVVGLYHAQEYTCDFIQGRVSLVYGRPNCGDGTCTCYGKVARCVGNRTVAIVPKLDDNIEQLYVECYGFKVLNRAAFTNIKHLELKEIHLLKNEIRGISEHVFKFFQNLSVLELTDNSIINTTSLQLALGSVQKGSALNLTLNNIGLSIVTGEFFQYLNTSNVIHVNLTGNKIETLNLTAFSQLPALKVLNLEGNWISNFTGTNKLNTLQILNLGHNQLHSKGSNFCLADGSSIFPNIKTLLLSNNYISFGSSYIQSWNCLKSLVYLSLKNNTIKQLDISLLSNMTSLKILNVGSNWIQSVTPGEYPPVLEEIDFRNNQFVTFPPFLCPQNGSSTFGSITKLNFSRNYIQKIITRNWSCLPNIKVLDFSKNDVGALENNTFAHFTSLTALYLDNMIPWVKHIEPLALNNTSLESLSLRFDWIDFRRAEVQGLFEFCPNVKTIDISYNYFFNLTESAILKILSPMKDLEVLKAQRISLRDFPATFLTKLKKLKHLDINRNMLRTVQFPEDFNDPSLNLSIRFVSVAEGDINEIDQTAFPSSIMNALEVFDLSGNEFACNCDNEWFRDIIKKGKVGKIELKGWPEKYVCRSPTSQVNTLFKDYEPDEECSPIPPMVVAFIAIGSSFFVFVVLSGTAYYNKWYLQYYWYKMIRRRREARSKEPDEQALVGGIKYDGYVVYSQEDDVFVHHRFRSLLEEKLNYKLHIWKRSAAHGALVEVILDAIYASRNVIVIVSNNLIKDQWCKFQVDVAIDRSIDLGEKCVMLVVLDDIDFGLVSKTWCVLLAKTPKAYWTSGTTEEDEDDIKGRFLELTIKQQLGQPLSTGSNGYASVQH